MWRLYSTSKHSSMRKLLKAPFTCDGVCMSDRDKMVKRWLYIHKFSLLVVGRSGQGKPREVPVSSVSPREVPVSSVSPWEAPVSPWEAPVCSGWVWEARRLLDCWKLQRVRAVWCKLCLISNVWPTWWITSDLYGLVRLALLSLQRVELSIQEGWNVWVSSCWLKQCLCYSINL